MSKTTRPQKKQAKTSRPQTKQSKSSRPQKEQATRPHRRTTTKPRMPIEAGQVNLDQDQAARVRSVSTALLRDWKRKGRLKEGEHIIYQGRKPTYRRAVVEAIAAQGIDSFAPRPSPQ